jgi:hypothetical protein
MSTFVNDSAVAWTGAEYTDILVQTFADSITMVNCRVLDGVKGKAKIGGLSSSRMLGKVGCEFTENGDVTYANKSIEVSAIGPSQRICYDDLRSMAMELNLKTGTQDGMFLKPEMQQKLLDLFKGMSAEEIEICLWQGVDGAGGTVLEMFDGFNVWIAASADVTKVAAPVAIDASNVIAEIDRMIVAIPNRLKTKRRMAGWKILVSTNVMSSYIQAMALIPGNTQVIINDAATFDRGVSRAGYMIEERYGMDDNQMLFCNEKKDLIIGTDTTDDMGSVSLEPQRQNGSFSILIIGLFMLGTQIGRDVDMVSYGI